MQENPAPDARRRIDKRSPRLVEFWVFHLSNVAHSGEFRVNQQF
jgi:hypothetical protein